MTFCVFRLHATKKRSTLTCKLQRSIFGDPVIYSIKAVCFRNRLDESATEGLEPSKIGCKTDGIGLGGGPVDRIPYNHRY